MNCIDFATKMAVQTRNMSKTNFLYDKLVKGTVKQILIFYFFDLDPITQMNSKKRKIAILIKFKGMLEDSI